MHQAKHGKSHWTNGLAAQHFENEVKIESDPFLYGIADRLYREIGEVYDCRRDLRFETSLVSVGDEAIAKICHESYLSYHDIAGKSRRLSVAEFRHGFHAWWKLHGESWYRGYEAVLSKEGAPVIELQFDQPQPEAQPAS